jgi:hypothetical protein
MNGMGTSKSTSILECSGELASQKAIGQGMFPNHGMLETFTGE